MNQDAVIAKMVEMFGDRIVDPEVLPATFAYQVKLTKYQIFVETPAEPEIAPV